MPTITLNKKEFLSLVNKKLNDDKLGDRLAMLGTDVKEITKDEISTEIFPNRPDLLSVEGLARAFSSFLGVKTGLREYKVIKTNYRTKIEANVKKVRPFGLCAVLKNLKLTDEVIVSIMQIQEKLHMTHGRNRAKVAIGIHDLDKIKFPVTYCAKPQDFKFTPLNSNKEMTLKEILEKHPKGVEYAHLLQEFKEYPIWIDANRQVLSMPPIINSEETKVTEKTKNLFLDVTGTDLNAVELALNIIVTAFADRNAEINTVKIQNNYYPDLIPKKIKLSLSYVNKLLGLEIDEKEVKQLLGKMGIGYKNGYALVPAYRTDVLHQIDIAEDIAIAYGYENFKEEIPNLSTVGAESDFEKFKDKIADLLIGLNLIEASTYHLSNKNIQNKNMQSNLPCVELENAVNADYNVLRSWLIPNLLEVLGKNKHNEFPQKIFEIGKIFKIKEDKVKEPTRVGILLTHLKTNFTEIKQILDALLSNLEAKYEVKPVEHDSFIPGRVGRVSIKGKDVAYIGEIHPSVLEAFELENPVVALELNLTDLFKIL